MQSLKMLPPTVLEISFYKSVTEQKSKKNEKGKTKDYKRGASMASFGINDHTHTSDLSRMVWRFRELVLRTVLVIPAQCTYN